MAAMPDDSFWKRINRPAEPWQVRWMAVICFASAALLIFGTVFPYREIPDLARRWLAVGLTFGAGVLYWSLARWFRVWMLHTIVTVGFAWGCLGLASADGPVAAALTLSTLLWTCVYVGSAFPPRIARIYGVGLWAGLTIAIVLSGVEAGASLAIAFGASFLVTMEILSRATTRLREEASTDPLTGLLNRKGLERASQPLIAAGASGRDEVAVLHADLDGFKAINDRDGHRAGDRVLVEMADAWKAASREGDLLARIGGDEFVAVLFGVDRAGAEALTERLKSVSPVEWSSGLSMVGPGDRLEDCLARADVGLYEEKVARRRLDPKPGI